MIIGIIAFAGCVALLILLGFWGRRAAAAAPRVGPQLTPNGCTEHCVYCKEGQEVDAETLAKTLYDAAQKLDLYVPNILPWSGLRTSVQKSWVRVAESALSALKQAAPQKCQIVGCEKEVAAGPRTCLEHTPGVLAPLPPNQKKDTEGAK